MDVSCLCFTLAACHNWYGSNIFAVYQRRPLVLSSSCASHIFMCSSSSLFCMCTLLNSFSCVNVCVSCDYLYTHIYLIIGTSATTTSKRNYHTHMRTEKKNSSLRCFPELWPQHPHVAIPQHETAIAVHLPVSMKEARLVVNLLLLLSVPSK